MEEEKKHTSKLKKHISLADWHDCMLIYHAMCQSHHKVNKNEIVHILKSVEMIYKKWLTYRFFWCAKQPGKYVWTNIKENNRRQEDDQQ